MNLTLAFDQFVTDRLIPPLIVLTSVLAAAPTAWGYTAIVDHDVTEQVEAELLFDPAVPFNTIDVKTTEGIVTITGTATNLLAKERATRIAETVRGVRSVINRIKVDPAVDQSAQELQEAVKRALFYDTATESYEIDVSADDRGQVTLSGTVDSWAERSLAETVTKNVSGVVSVRNEIHAVPKSNRPDIEIKPEIEKRLRWDALVDAALIDVRVDDGKVFLSGTVGSAAEKRRAKAQAWIDGVEAVDSSGLKVANWARKRESGEGEYLTTSDPEIREAVKDALGYDPRVSASDIDVKVRGGIATLQGLVDNLQAKKAAERDARNTAGVFGLVNLIKVRPIAKMDDEKIAANVRYILAVNPFTESYDIDVRVKNQVVHLDGTVDSVYEKVEAENVAFRAAGVSDVRNNLTVNHPETLSYDPHVYEWSIYDYPWYKGSTAMIQGKTDREISRAIENELLWSPFVDGDEVNVSVEGGIATLTGAVDSWSEYIAARENAFEGGAASVINKLTVR